MAEPSWYERTDTADSDAKRRGGKVQERVVTDRWYSTVQRTSDSRLRFNEARETNDQHQHDCAFAFVANRRMDGRTGEQCRRRTSEGS